MDNAPFAIGDKVVCLKDGKWTPIRKGDVCTVTGLLYKNCCPASTGWFISLAEYNSNKLSKCPTCLTDSTIFGQHFLAKYFAPIQPMYENMSKQIAESITQTDEVPDKIFVPQTVNN